MAAKGDAQYLRRGLGAVCFTLLACLARILPYGAFSSLGKGVLGVFYAVTGKKLRKTAKDSLDIAFGGQLSMADKQRITAASAANLMQGFPGIVYSAFHPGWAERIFSLEGQAGLDDALQKGKGAVIAIAHFGPFAWMIFKFIDRGYRANVVMRPPRNGFIYDQLLKSKGICGLNIIYSVPVRKCVLNCLQALSNGELVFMPVDQNYGGAGRVFVDFFGRKAATAPGPVMFALKAEAPLFFAYALPEGRGRYRIMLSPRLELVKAASEKETLVINTAAVTKKVEDIARKHPEQWSWMHKRWKAVPREGEL